MYIINRQKNLLQNDCCELILKNFNRMVGDLFKNEWQNRKKSRKGCRYSDEITVYVYSQMIHYTYSFIAYTHYYLLY